MSNIKTPEVNFSSVARGFDDGTPENRPRRPQLAALMSLLLPGFGQLYNGECNKAIWLFLIFTGIIVPVPVLVALYLPGALTVPLLLIGLALTIICWIYAVADAWRGARQRSDYLPAAWQQSGVYLLVFVACNVLALPLMIGYVRANLLESFRIPSSSMSPSILQGDYLFADKRYNCPNCKYAVARGDLAVFTYPNDRTLRYIKRIIGLPGDRVQLQGRAFTVNGQPLSVSELAQAQGLLVIERLGERQWSVLWNPLEKLPADREWVVPQGQVFVLGDSRSQSTDSRGFGTVPLQDVIGRARQVWYSSDAAGIRWGRLGAVLR